MARASALLILCSPLLTAGGAYNFWKCFDGGSMLYLGDSPVMNNDGYHGETWKDGVRNFTQGEHFLVVFSLRTLEPQQRGGRVARSGR